MFERDVEFEADKFYNGTGGISKLYFGTSFKISKSLSVGANASYLFGAINREKRIIFDDESIFHSRSVERVNIKGYDYEIGLLFKNIFTGLPKLLSFIVILLILVLLLVVS